MDIALEQTLAPQAGQPHLSEAEAQELTTEVPHWTLSGDKLEQQFKFRDFNEAMMFVNEVARIAKEADHHPDIRISYSTVKLELSTHKIGGLSRNDFIVAARIDRLLGNEARG